MHIRSAATLLCLVLAAGPALAADDAPKTEDEKTVYAIGLSMARGVSGYNLSKREIEMLMEGLEDALLGREPKVDAAAYQAKIHNFAQERMKVVAEEERKASVAFLEKAASEKGAVKTESGLIYVEIKPGDGAKPAATDTVKVHYHGTLRDGSVFDSSVDRGTPATFPLNRVIPCWTEGVQRMKVGGKSKLICPSTIAYGDRGAPPKIKPGAALVFEVELLGIEKPAEGAQKPAEPGKKPAEGAEKPAGHP